MADETPSFTDQKKAELSESDPRLRLESHCKEARVDCSWIWHEPRLIFRIDFPNGRNKRREVVTTKRAEELLSIDFPPFTYLGDFDAALFTSAHAIEATILRASPSILLQGLPGVRRIGHPQLDLLELDEDDESESRLQESRLTPSDAWTLEFKPTPDRPDLRVAIGSVSREFNLIADRDRRRMTSRNRDPLPHGLGRFTTIRISGVNVTRHDEALDLLNRVSGAVFFELDLQYGAALMLAPSSEANRARAGNRLQQEMASTVPRNPRNQYPEKPLSLYWYGRSSVGIPLLEYLAYYQVLEYFFPSFSHRDTLEKLRNELLDPRFRPDDDGHLVRILNLTSGAGKGYGSEREQLRSTVGGCVTESHIRNFIENNDALAEHFSGRQKVKSVGLLDLNAGNSDLLTAVSNRVYDIRCRIVHAKEDGGKAAVDPLLPFSKEAEALGPDIELVKFLAQKVLIAEASRLHL
ncbi:hypothetical protein ABZT34_07865 [Streptomyces sp. NPDC005329]|uniref:hypothetical protein n=1 Tax=Streptomyces sp. NPDC005329 TaxID=3157034 RepID=UPI0033B8BF5F